MAGGGAADADSLARAETLGRELAARGAVVVCGGTSGVMEAVARGAAGAGGLTLGILPGTRAEDANPWIVVPLPTGMGHARNALVARAGEALVAVAGSWGTLSEIALAKAMGLPAAVLGPPPLDGLGVPRFDDPAEAAAWAVAGALERRGRHG